MAKHGNFIIRTALLCLGLALLFAGIWRGEPTEILHRATTVCLECIGIG